MLSVSDAEGTCVVESKETKYGDDSGILSVAAVEQVVTLFCLMSVREFFRRSPQICSVRLAASLGRARLQLVSLVYLCVVEVLTCWVVLAETLWGGRWIHVPV